MARYNMTFESQSGQIAGTPSGTTVNGYLGCWGAGASAGFYLRKIGFGVRGPSGSVTSQQLTIGVYRQTVLPVGTGLTTTAGLANQFFMPADPTGGLIVTTATTIGTTGPTIGASALAKVSLNQQSWVERNWEFMDELICNSGTANGFAFVLLGNGLTASHLVTAEVEVEV